ncbi:MAG TPA: hypothetical protein VK507_19270 [Iamia sp.]|nr:hypothetical protein [Iamia sp.]
MTDPIAVLQRAAEEAGARARETDPVAAVRARVEHRRRGRRVRRAAAAAAVVLLLVGVVAVVAAQGDDQEGVVVSPNPDPTTPSPTDAEVPPSPLAARNRVALAPAGDEVVVWGGVSGQVTELSDGAAYDRTTGEWRMLAPSPLPVEESGGMVPVAAPVEGGVVVARGTTVARWDQATGTWDRLDDAPGLVADLTAVTDGRLVSISAGAVLDVAGGAWVRPTAPPPYGLERTTQVWTDDEVLVLGASPDGDPDRTYILGFDPEAVAWREVAPPPAAMVGPAGVAAAWDGERVVVTDDEMRAATYDPTSGAWERLEAVPARFAEHYPSMASVDGATVVSMALTLAVLEPGQPTWTPFPSPNPSDGGGPPGQWLVPVDDTTIGTWIDDAGPNDPDLALFDPTAVGEREQRRQVGVVAVALGPDDEVEGATSNRLDGRVVLQLDPAERGPCRIENGFPLPQGTPEQRAVEVEVEVLSGPKLWFHDTAGTHWETEVGDQDLVTIDCDDPAAASRLVAAMELAQPT